VDVLLDTQTLVWSLEDERLLSVTARDTILGADTVFVSPVNFYEIAIKLAIGKNPGIKQTLGELVVEARLSGFTWLPIIAAHLEAYLRLPLYDHHRDPFDRLILATALADGLSVVSSDRNFPLYGYVVPVVW
jgi:PIN domain nuclease of toxin-antitoxin system